MTTPVAVTSAISTLNTALAAASPLANQSLTALQPSILAAGNLVSALDTAILGAAGALDGPDPSGMPQDIVSELLSLSASSTDQSSLVDMRGYAGRLLLNLKQATG